ncbi:MULTISPECIES: DUF418 domain-containing protein [Staphylococcus]|uniref:DUF418 domain-containing protein n=1 Tax=Staphylococcus TaxID=1279 RepID=UPI00034AAA7D|nr:MULTISPECIES: DUF418 domain-containing protein [Staphylococcus]MDW8543243.1 DUF418 domain-containing protein [Staphylococcus sp. KG4-1]MDW8562662.1 DUF418 domain-containing protein [Staphylococcus sp. KG4-3]
MNKINNRIETLDFLRGFALLGIILVNIIAIAQLPAPELSNDITYKKFLDFFIESKFFAIFSYLFGIGFYIFMQRAEHKVENKYVIFLRRIIVLGIFGFFHMQLQSGEALLIYAIFGLLLIPFFKVNKYINLVIGVIILVFVIWLDAKFLIPFPYFILGLASAQFEIIFKFKTTKKIWSIVAIASGIVSLLGWYVLNKFYVVPHIDLSPQQLQKNPEDYIVAVDQYHHLITIFSPFMSLFYISCLILLLNMTCGRFILTPLKYYGRMALTNYIGQTLIICLLILIFDGEQWSLLNTLWICLMIYIVQIISSLVWLKYFKLGPLEYIWKLATYMKWINMTK